MKMARGIGGIQPGDVVVKFDGKAIEKVICLVSLPKQILGNSESRIVPPG